MMVALVVEAGLCLPKRPARRLASPEDAERHERHPIAHVPLDALVARRSRSSAVLATAGLLLRRLAAERLSPLAGAARAAAAGARRPRRPCCSISPSGSRSSAPRRSRRSPCSGTPRPAWRPATSSGPTSSVVGRPARRPAARRSRALTRAGVLEPRSARGWTSSSSRSPPPDGRRHGTDLYEPLARAPETDHATCAGSCWPPTATGTRARRRSRPPPGCG